MERWNPGNGGVSKDIAMYNNEQHFNIVGWINFVKEQTHRLNAKATSFSILQEIDRQAFIEVIKSSA